MKRTKRMILLSAILVLCITVQPVSAAGRNNYGRTYSNNVHKTNSWTNNRGNSWKNWWNQWEEEETEEITENSPAVEENVSVMSLVENETTVENGEMLRAATYDLRVADESSTEGDSTILKYFPVTLYDYDETTINNATKEVERAANNGADLEEWQGIYFSGGDPSPNQTGTTVDKSGFVDGAQYYIQNARAAGNGAGSWLVGSQSAITSTANQEDATLWTLEVNEDGTFSLKTTINNNGTDQDMYMTISSQGANGDGLSAEKVNLTIQKYNGSNQHNVGTTSECVEILGTKYLCQWGGTTVTNYGGENNSGDTGNAMRFYRVDGEEQTLVSITNKITYDGPLYANWNHWDKSNTADNRGDGQKIYTGLVERSLDVNKDIVFAKPDGGIFNSDETVKNIYPGVEVPFVYEDGYYIFDASVNGVYFKQDDGQKSTATAEVLPDETGTSVTPRLYFDKGTTQSNGSYADGSTTVWAPFNSGTQLTGMNYHFGMRATIPFSMTPNGRVVATQDSSDPIVFNFSGDDDVWVFIDGQLVIDLGGIHNRLDAEIDFAANTVTYSESNSLTVETGSINDENFELTQTLFGNLISMDRTSFASMDHHELTIFYLERGQGSSNAEIKFNLPVNDSVIVTKDATRSWNSKEEGADAISPLSAKEQKVVNEIPFGFILYRSTDGGNNFEAVSNTKYYLMNSNGQVIDNPSTAADGHFYLKNGQSAKFITTNMDDSDQGVIYYVHEEAREGFVDPDYNYSGKAANGYRYKYEGYVNEETGEITGAIDQEYEDASDIPELEVFDGSGNSGQVTVYGSAESEDSIKFLCSNFMDANLPNPGVRPVEDNIVIDFGLPVEIDVLKNDVYRGESIEVLKVAGQGMKLEEGVGASTEQLSAAGAAPVYGTAEIVNGKIVYTLNKQLTGVEVLNYLVKVTGTSTNEGGTTNVAYEYAVGTVYIVPATTMYYEENFSDFVTYTGKYWNADYTVDSTYQNNYQEPGVVGTIDDSPYGSDAAYFNDSKDSNGTSRYACTTNSAVKFEYTFTGTGTSFFARSTNNSGYMRVVLSDKKGNVIQTLFRNTVYLTEDDEATLYNVPVFTTDELDYGTYTVTVTVAKENAKVGYCGEFWLDGIRVMQPIDEKDSNYSVAAAAYAADSEQNMTNVTLRNKLLRETDYDDEGNPVWTEGGNFVLFTDIDGSIDTAEEYESIGPKEEVYLNAGQTVSFSLYNWDSNVNKVYLGMKAPLGSGTVTIGNTAVKVNNAADCYYDISRYAKVTTDDTTGIMTATFDISATDGLISVTNIKVTGDGEFVIINEEDKEIDGDVGSGDSEDIEIDGSEAEGTDQ